MLKYYGVNISVDDVINNLRKEELPYMEDNILYGGNPEVGFVGDPYSYSGYGVYEIPISEVDNKYNDGINIKREFDFSEVLNLVKNGHPVMVWTSMNLAIPYVSRSWIYKPTGEVISWRAQEHAVIVVGYNNNYVIISDPIGGTIKYQSRGVFEQRYNYYGRKILYY